MSKCIICNSIDLLRAGKTFGYIEGGKYIIFQCKQCGTSQASPHISDAKLYNIIYKNADTAPGYMRYSVYANEIKKTSNPVKYLSKKEEMYYGLFKALKERSAKGSDVLDVGCGLGYVSYALHKAGYNVTGVDISTKSIEKAKFLYGDYFISENFFNFSADKKLYDVICMLELIEHVGDPFVYIKHAMSLLKKDGLLIITTPNKDFSPKDSIWNTDLPPVHLTWFSEKGFCEIAKRLGCRFSFTSFTSFNFLHGTICYNFVNAKKMRKPFFSEDGKKLYSEYHKSKKRILAEKIYLYSILKKIFFFYKKIIEIVKVMLNPKLFVGAKSNTICVVVSK